MRIICDYITIVLSDILAPLLTLMSALFRDIDRALIKGLFLWWTPPWFIYWRGP